VTSHFNNKTLAVFLAALFGSLGAHRFYLEGARSWKGWCYCIAFFLLFAFGLDYSLRDPAFGLHMPYDVFRPAMLLAGLPGLVAMLDAILLALTPDERFDTRFNAGQSRHNQSGGLVVTFAALTLAVGAGIMTLMLAVDLEAAVDLMPHQALDQAPAPH
jgi:hypothetical protein